MWCFLLAFHIFWKFCNFPIGTFWGGATNYVYGVLLNFISENVTTKDGLEGLSSHRCHSTLSWEILGGKLIQFCNILWFLKNGLPQPHMPVVLTGTGQLQDFVFIANKWLLSTLSMSYYQFLHIREYIGKFKLRKMVIFRVSVGFFSILHLFHSIPSSTAMVATRAKRSMGFITIYNSPSLCIVWTDSKI
jgi:hypothetical protein